MSVALLVAVLNSALWIQFIIHQYIELTVYPSQWSLFSCEKK